MKLTAILILSAALTVFAVPQALADKPDENQIVSLAVNWLESIDAKYYGQSWDEASALF